MADFKKFMFDNFVVEKDDSNHENFEQLVDVVEPLVVDDKSLNEDNIEENVDEDDTFEDFNFDYDNKKEDEMITIASSELELKLKAARDEGYEEAYKSSQSSTSNKEAEALSNLDENLKAIFEKMNLKIVDIEKECGELLKVSIKKIVPSLLEKDAKEIVTEFVKNNFSNIKNEAKLSFYFNSEIIAYMQENISKLARTNDFEGNISIHKDDSLMVSDCRIEWEKGGVERNSKAILNKVDEILN